MESKIKAALTEDISEMLECVTQDEKWKGCLDHFEYEFLIDRDGHLIYEQWSDSCEEEVVEMKNCPQFKELKGLNYTGVCHVRFNENDKLIIDEVADDDHILEVSLTNSLYHTPNPEHKEPPVVTGAIDFTAGGLAEDERYYFALTDDLELQVEAEASLSDENGEAEKSE